MVSGYTVDIRCSFSFSFHSVRESAQTDRMNREDDLTTDWWLEKFLRKLNGICIHTKIGPYYDIHTFDTMILINTFYVVTTEDIVLTAP